ncbi:hypothetical protein B0H13DRAFT_826224 [Mycena leptocephala]|nr:hypothetical protein B0H13DRAFT_826224 [Mycena leptocephala]
MTSMTWCGIFPASAPPESVFWSSSDARNPVYAKAGRPHANAKPWRKLPAPWTKNCLNGFVQMMPGGVSGSPGRGIKWGGSMTGGRKQRTYSVPGYLAGKPKTTMQEWRPREALIPEFAQADKIKDARGRAPKDVGYDPTTLLIPPQQVAALNDARREFWLVCVSNCSWQKIGISRQ